MPFCGVDGQLKVKVVLLLFWGGGGLVDTVGREVGRRRTGKGSAGKAGGKGKEEEGRTNKVTWALDRARIVVRMVRVRVGCMALVVAALGGGEGEGMG